MLEGSKTGPLVSQCISELLKFQALSVILLFISIFEGFFKFPSHGTKKKKKERKKKQRAMTITKKDRAGK